MLEMPRLLHHNCTFHNSSVNDYDISVAYHLSGCEPKYEIHFENATFLYKPARKTRDALNELLAYQLNIVYDFDRVPLVLPMQVPLSRLRVSHQPKNYLKCNMHLQNEIWMQRGEMVVGSMQLKIEGVQQRGEIVRFVDRTVSDWIGTENTTTNLALQHAHQRLFPSGPNVMAQRERETRAIFDYLTGNIDRFNNDFVVSRGNAKLLVYIDNNRVTSNFEAFDLKSQTPNCRFYFRPIQRIQQISNPSNVLWKLASQHLLVREWFNNRIPAIPMLHSLDERARVVQRRVKECIAAHGKEYVFWKIK